MSAPKEVRAAERNARRQRRNELIAAAFNSPSDSVPLKAPEQPSGPAFAPVVVQAKTPWFVIAGSIASVAALVLVFVMIRKKG